MMASTDIEVSFATADRTLLAPYGLDANGLAQVFGGILQHNVDYADLYFQYSRSESWSLEEGPRQGRRLQHRSGRGSARGER